VGVVAVRHFTSTAVYAPVTTRLVIALVAAFSAGVGVGWYAHSQQEVTCTMKASDIVQMADLIRRGVEPVNVFCK
jgi:hypothetical protein